MTYGHMDLVLFGCKDPKKNKGLRHYLSKLGITPKEKKILKPWKKK